MFEKHREFTPTSYEVDLQIPKLFPPKWQVGSWAWRSRLDDETRSMTTWRHGDSACSFDVDDIYIYIQNPFYFIIPNLVASSFANGVRQYSILKYHRHVWKYTSKRHVPKTSENSHPKEINGQIPGAKWQFFCGAFWDPTTSWNREVVNHQLEIQLAGNEKIDSDIIYIYIFDISIILYRIISIHTIYIYMYKDVYSMIYHNIHDKQLAKYHQHIVDISLPRCDHKSWSLPASSSSGTTVWEKHASLQNTQIDISYMLLHHANIFVWFSTHGNTPLSTLGQPCFRFSPGAMSDDSPQINHHWHHWEGGKLEIPWSNIHCRFRMTHILLNIIELQFNVSQSFIEVKVPLTASKTVNGNHHMQLAFRACWLLEPTVMVTLECHTWLTWNIFDSLIHVWTAALICPHRSETLESVEPVATYDYLTTSSHQPPNAALVVMPRHWKMI